MQRSVLSRLLNNSRDVVKRAVFCVKGSMDSVVFSLEGRRYYYFYGSSFQKSLFDNKSHNNSLCKTTKRIYYGHSYGDWLEYVIWLERVKVKLRTAGLLILVVYSVFKACTRIQWMRKIIFGKMTDGLNWKTLTWNLNSLRGDFVGRKAVITKMKMALKATKTKKRIIVMTGLSGIGKTETVRHFCRSGKYHSVFHVQSHNKTSIAHCLKRNLQEMGYPYPIPWESINDIRFLGILFAAALSSLTRKQKIAVVFDDVDSEEMLSFLEEMIPENEHVDTFVTTRCYDCNLPGTILNLSNLTHAESLEFINKRLGNTEFNEELAVTSTYHPLMLNHLCSYINMLRKGDLADDAIIPALLESWQGHQNYSKRSLEYVKNDTYQLPTDPPKINKLTVSNPGSMESILNDVIQKHPVMKHLLLLYAHAGTNEIPRSLVENQYIGDVIPVIGSFEKKYESIVRANAELVKLGMMEYTYDRTMGKRVVMIKIQPVLLDLMRMKHYSQVSVMEENKSILGSLKKYMFPSDKLVEEEQKKWILYNLQLTKKSICANVEGNLRKRETNHYISLYHGLFDLARENGLSISNSARDVFDISFGSRKVRELQRLDLENLRTFYELGLELGTGKNVSVLNSLGCVYLAMGRTKEGLELVNKAKREAETISRSKNYYSILSNYLCARMMFMKDKKFSMRQKMQILKELEMEDKEGVQKTLDSLDKDMQWLREIYLNNLKVGVNGDFKLIS